jgi:hypothetical protein
MSTTTTTRARRSALLLLALLASLGLLAGCGSSDSGSEGAKDDDTKTTVEETETEAVVDVTIAEVTTTTTTAPAETTTTDKAATTTTTAVPTPEITSIQFATSLEPNGSAIDPATSFPADSGVIYASVLVKPLPKGTVIEGDFDAAGSTLPSTSITAPADYPEVYLQFKLESGGSFVPGTYTFATTIDGKAGPQLDFTIE